MQTLFEFFEDFPTRQVKKGDLVIEQGTQDDLVFLIKEGAVEVLKDNVVIAEVRDALAVFGEMAILLDQPHTATVRALEDSEFYIVDDAKKVLAWKPEAALYVAEILARRLDSLNKYLVDVKSQFKEYGDHLSMVDEVLDTLMNKHPRYIERRPTKDQ